MRGRQDLEHLREIAFKAFVHLLRKGCYTGAVAIESCGFECSNSAPQHRGAALWAGQDMRAKEERTPRASAPKPLSIASPAAVNEALRPDAKQGVDLDTVESRVSS